MGHLQSGWILGIGRIYLGDGLLKPGLVHQSTFQLEMEPKACFGLSKASFGLQF
jgi:hypothetical protein